MKNRSPEHARLRRSFLKGSLATGAAIAGARSCGTLQGDPAFSIWQIAPKGEPHQ
jgi:hypothetical protein